MTYVEWLRARRALIVVGVILAAFVVLAFGAKIWLLQYETTDTFVNHVAMQGGTTRSELTLPDGTHRTVYDNPLTHDHIVIDRSGYARERITIDTPHNSDRNIGGATIGTTKIATTHDGKMDHIVIKNDPPDTLSPYLAVGWFLAMIVATMLGAPFARENDGHLEIAFTKPVSRTTLALGMVAVDGLAIVATVFATAIVVMILSLLFEPLRLSWQDAPRMIASTLLVPLGWYALLNAATASLRRGYGVIIGLSWPVLFGLNGLIAIPWDQSAFGRFGWFVSHAFFSINPISYLNLGGSAHIDTAPIAQSFTNTDLGLLVALALFIVYTALAVVQWRRVEA